MKILHIIPNLSSGGAERFVVDLVNEMSKTHDVYLCTLYRLVPESNDFFVNEISKRVQLVSLNKKIGLDLQVFASVYKLLKKINPDVIHTHLTAINYILPVALISKRKKFFHTIHNDAFREVHHKIELLTRKFFYKFKLINPITISEESRNSFIKAYNLPRPQMIYNGRLKPAATCRQIEVKEQVDSLKNSKNTIVLLNIGRVTKQKNQLMLIKVVNRLVIEGYDLILLIIGSDGYGEESVQAKKTIEAIRSKYVFLLGNRDNVFDYLLQADAFCLTSLYEGLPISLLEAMAAGSIPVCTPVGGIPEIIGNSKIGFVSEKVDETSYYEALKQLLNNFNKDAMKEALMTTFNMEFDIKITSKNYVDLYCSLMKQNI